METARDKVAPKEPEPKKPDYEKMWRTLEKEVDELVNQSCVEDSLIGQVFQQMVSTVPLSALLERMVRLEKEVEKEGVD